MEKEVKRLVNRLTGFREGSENFRRILQFIQSNLRFHRYMDPDSHKITRTLEGIQEKLLVHSQPEKASALKDYIATFLNAPLSEDSEFTKTVGHYAVLSFLLQLSNSPINATFQERKPEPKRASEPKFDWTKHLLEGLPPVRSFQDSSDEEWSEEDDDEENTLRAHHLHPDNGSSQEPFALSTRRRDKAQLYGESWTELGGSVVVQYWEGERDPLLHSMHQSHQTTAQWNEIERSDKPFPTNDERFQMTETQIIRESIWVLIGAGKSFLYQLRDECYTARKDVQVSHLTTASLQCITTQLAELGTKVYQLQAFIDRTRGQALKYCRGQRSNSARRTASMSEKEAASPLDSGEESQTGIRKPSVSASSDREISGGLPDIVRDVSSQRGSTKSNQDELSGKSGPFCCQTYEAFAEALSKFLEDFRARLVKEEKKAVAQEETYTLTMFHEWLREWKPLITLSHDLYRRGVRDITTDVPSLRVSALLRVLHAAIKDHFCLGFEAKILRDLLWQLWSITTRPYIQFITKWLMHGILLDPAQEFAIHRNQEIHIKSESFWSKAFSLQSLPVEETDGAALSHPANQRAALSHPSNQREAQRASSIVGRGVCSAVPEFLQPVLPHILLAGKSMEILEATGKLSRAQFEELVKFSDQGIAGLLPSAPSSLHPRDKKHKGTGAVSLNTGPTLPPSPPPSPLPSAQSTSNVEEVIQQQLAFRGYNDPLIAREMADIGPAENLEALGSEHNREEQECETGNPSSFEPLELVLYRELYPAIITRCQSVCSSLATVLQKDFSLQGHFLCLRRFFLLEAGDVMYDFYSELFSKIRRHEPWQDLLNLNYQLQETLSSRYPDEAARITLGIEPQRLTAKMATQPIHALDVLSLHYKVPWPVDIIINHHALDIYNQVFRFLLQVKRAQYCLQQLRFPDLTRSMARRSGIESTDDEEGIMSALNTAKAQEAVREKLPLIHRLFILRFRLLHFVNAVHNYLMTRILYSTGLEFSAEVDQALDLDQIIAAHRAYLSKISERCLLHHKVSFVREAVSKVLNLALTFQRRWDAGVHTFSDSNVAKAEEEFYNCNEFLSTLLANIIRRGTFPHLEALALSLSGPRPKGKAQDLDQQSTRNR